MSKSKEKREYMEGRLASWYDLSPYSFSHLGDKELLEIYENSVKQVDDLLATYIEKTDKGES